MIMALSAVVLLGFTSYSIFRTFKRRRWLSCMAGMMIAMTVGMIASVAFGTIVGLMYQPDLTIPTVAAVLFGMVCGYLSGKPVSVMAALDGMLSGIMGGMMGAMLGVMTTQHPNVILLFVDVVLVFVFLVLQQFINEEAVGKPPLGWIEEAKETAEQRTALGPVPRQSTLLHPVVFGLGIVAVAAVFLYQDNADHVSKQADTNIHDHSSAR